MLDPRPPIAGLHELSTLCTCGRVGECGDRDQKRHSRVRGIPVWRFADDLPGRVWQRGRRGSVFILEVLAAKTFCTHG
jgi:hypothetical protein